MAKNEDILKKTIATSMSSDFGDYDSNLLNVGVDVVEISRMKEVIARTPSFKERLFSSQERQYCEKFHDSIPHYAARFAAKEAVVKALGVGFSQGVAYRDIEVIINKFGKPVVVLSGAAQRIAQSLEVVEMPISLSHTHQEAVCCALAVTESYIESQKRTRSSSEIIASSFKDLRLSLDEI